MTLTYKFEMPRLSGFMGYKVQAREGAMTGVWISTHYKGRREEGGTRDKMAP